MEPSVIALIGFAVMFALVAAHVPIGVSMAVVGVVGFAFLAGWGPATRKVWVDKMRIRKNS